MTQNLDKELKNLKDELNEIRWLVSRILAIIPSIIIGIDSRGFVTEWNIAAERTFFIPYHDVIGKPLAECGVQWNIEEITKQVNLAFSRSLPVRLNEFRFIGPKGEEQFLDITMASFMNSQNARSGIIIAGSLLPNPRKNNFTPDV